MIEYIALTNFFSFKERTEFSLKATKEKPRGTFSGEDWWTKIDGIKLLKAAFLLGNNGSGKTNFLNGLSVLNELVTVNRNSKLASRYIFNHNCIGNFVSISKGERILYRLFW